jgi:glycerophosphoryl diester phosphodiesterase
LSVQKNDTVLYQWGGPHMVGHRGNVKFTPENTLPALDKAIELGADLVEIDVRQTSDGVLVLMHDLTVDRATDGTGPIANMTLNEVQKLDAGSWFDEKFAGTKVPTLREALNHIRGRAIPDIDFKSGSPDELIRVLDEEGFLASSLTLYSGSWDLLGMIKQKTDKLLLRPTVPFGLSGLPIVLQELNPEIININWEQFSEGLVQSVHLSGKKSFLNTMQHDTEFGMRKMIQTMPDYIQSDHLDILVPMINETGY